MHNLITNQGNANEKHNVRNLIPIRVFFFFNKYVDGIVDYRVEIC